MKLFYVVLEDDYRYFCMVISQHYISPLDPNDAEYKIFKKDKLGQRHFSPKAMKMLSDKEKKALKEKINRAHEQVFNSMMCIPPQLFFIFRYLGMID